MKNSEQDACTDSYPNPKVASEAFAEHSFRKAISHTWLHKFCRGVFLGHAVRHEMRHEKRSCALALATGKLTQSCAFHVVEQNAPTEEMGIITEGCRNVG